MKRGIKMVSKWVCYLSKPLTKQGFRLYPREMWLGGREIDVVGRRNDEYWGFEFKSIRDDPNRAVKQCQTYINHFDYVVVIVEKTPSPRSKWPKKLEALGVGIWLLSTHDVDSYSGAKKLIIILEAKKQTPYPHARAYVEQKFFRYALKTKLIPMDESQTKLNYFG